MLIQLAFFYATFLFSGATVAETVWKKFRKNESATLGEKLAFCWFLACLMVIFAAKQG